MTFREKLMQEHPDQIGEQYLGGCKGCPDYYGYGGIPDYCDSGRRDCVCNACWNREVPESANPQKTPKQSYDHNLAKAVRVNRLVYLLGQIKGIASSTDTHRVRTTLNNAVDGIIELLQVPTETPTENKEEKET